MRKIFKLKCLLAMRGASIVLLLVITSGGVSLWGQTTPDTPLGFNPFDSVQKADFDAVSLSSGNVFVNIPLVEFPQLGKLKFRWSIAAASSTFGSLSIASGSSVGPPLCPIAVCHYALRENIQGTATIADLDNVGGGLSRSGQEGSIANAGISTDGGYVFHNAGVLSGTLKTGGLKTAPLTLETYDGSGIMWVGQNYPSSISNPSLLDRQGTRYNFYDQNVYDQTGTFLYVYRQDTLGNRITNGSTYFVDSVGRTIPSPWQSSSTEGCQGPLPVRSAQSWTVPAVAPAGTATYKFCYVWITGQTNFQIGQGLDTKAEAGTGSNTYLQSVILPDGTSWVFEYNDRDPGDSTSINYGNITKITLPTGGTVSYTYGNMKDQSGTPIALRFVTSRTLNSNDGSAPRQWNYTWGLGSSPIAAVANVNVTDPAGSDTYYEFTLMDMAREVRRTYYQGSKAQGLVLLTKTTDWVDATQSTRFAFAPIRETLSWPSGPTSKRETDYDSEPFQSSGVINGVSTPLMGTFGDKTAIREYDYGTGVPGALLKTTLYSYPYQSNINYVNANIFDEPCLTTVYAGSAPAQPKCTPPPLQANLLSQTIYGFDEANGSPQGTYGNLTSTTRWLNNGTSPVSQIVYNSLGMPIKQIDPNQNTTTITYDSTGLFPKQIQFPSTNGAQHVEGFTYDPNSGLLTSHTDENNQLTQYFYNDPRSRLTQIRYAVNTPAENWTTYSYPSAIQIDVARDEFSKGDGSIKTTKLYDGLGRPVQDQLTSDPSGTVYTVTMYDPLGRVYSVTNPYRSTSDPTYGVTTFAYDALGRKTIQTNPDSSVRQWCYDGIASTGQTNCLKHIASATSEWVDVGEERGSDWQYSFDPFQRIASVIEPSGSSFTPTMETDYRYDQLGNLLAATQWGGPTGSSGARARSFTYDSLSRLISASNPETGTVCYGVTSGGSSCVNGYDGNGNLLFKTDARGVSVAYAYDARNRLVSKMYLYDSSKTPSTCYQYDTSSISGSNANLLGRLTNAWTQPTGAGACPAAPPAKGYLTLRSILAYDSMGRIANLQQCTPSNCTSGTPYTPSYTYDLAGHVSTFTNGVGLTPIVNTITFTNGFDGAGRLGALTSSWSDNTHPSTLFFNTLYSPHGGLINAALGNSALTVSRTYDNRLRATGETDMGNAINFPTAGSGVVAIFGAEQSK